MEKGYKQGRKSHFYNPVWTHLLAPFLSQTAFVLNLTSDNQETHVGRYIIYLVNLLLIHVPGTPVGGSQDL